MRLIDAEELLERFKWYEEMPTNPYLWDFLGIENVIGEVPTIEVPRWIPVTERVPEDGQSVLTYKNGICEVQTYETRRNGWVSGRCFWSMAFVTHWMPLPQPPKDGDT